jgi:light-regulated signal transduction histidine kinase (bacteriophytochrome)
MNAVQETETKKLESEYNKLQSEYKKKEKTVELFEAILGLLRHDLKNLGISLVNFLGFYLEELAKDKPDKKKLQLLKGKTRGNFQLLDLIIARIDDYRKMNTKMHSLIDVGKIFNEEINNFPELKEKGVKAFNQCRDCKIELNPVSPGHIFSTLIDNTRIHATDADLISLTSFWELTGNSKTFNIVYSDNGPGIEKERKETIFQNTKRDSGLYLVD